MPAYNYINPAFKAFAILYHVITSKHLKIYPHCFNLHISYFTSITIKLYLPLLQAFILLLPLFIYHLLYNMLIKYKILQLFFHNTKYLLPRIFIIIHFHYFSMSIGSYFTSFFIVVQIIFNLVKHIFIIIEQHHIFSINKQII